MSEGRKKQKQNPSYKGKGSEIVLVGRQPTSPPALWRVTAERRTRVCFCPLTPAVVVIHGMTGAKGLEKQRSVRTAGGSYATRGYPHREIAQKIAGATSRLDA